MALSPMVLEIPHLIQKLADVHKEIENTQPMELTEEQKKQNEEWFKNFETNNLKFENDMLRHQIDHLNNIIKLTELRAISLESMSIWQFIRFKLGF